MLHEGQTMQIRHLKMILRGFCYKNGCICVTNINRIGSLLIYHQLSIQDVTFPQESAVTLVTH